MGAYTDVAHVLGEDHSRAARPATSVFACNVHQSDLVATNENGTVETLEKHSMNYVPFSMAYNSKSFSCFCLDSQHDAWSLTTSWPAQLVLEAC